ncbi:hypothetical protein SDC9_139847 [bioreactor metagenome]|uniref:Uncharacterized protein n=1 Tax=bioreactor metagenome TaxID=1076179 RepID=A0A645DWK5_9ZZZZ
MQQDCTGTVQYRVKEIIRTIIAALDQVAVPAQNNNGTVITMIDKTAFCHDLDKIIQGFFDFSQINIQTQMKLVR